MNKLFIVLLAVHLVSVHAFVKREAESPKENNFFDEAIKSIQQSVKDVGAKMSDVFKPDNVKNFLDNTNKAFQNFANEMGSHNKDDKQ